MKKTDLQTLQEENRRLSAELDRLKGDMEAHNRLYDSDQSIARTAEWFSKFLQLLPQTIFEIDLEGNFRFLNDYSYQMFGYSKDDTIGNAFSMMVTSDLPRIRENMNLLLRGIDRVDREFTGIKKDGTTMPVLIYALPVFKGSVPTGFIGVILDITDRKKTESELRDSQKKYQDLTEQLPLGIYRTSLAGKFIFANKATARILGYNSVQELMSVDVKKIYTDPSIRKSIMKSLHSERYPTAKEFSIRKKDGSIIWIRDSFRLHKNDDTRKGYLEGIIEDITEKKILQEKLNHSQRLQSIGTLAGGIAHDFNNLIMGMQLFTELAMKSIEKDSATMKNLEKVAHAQIKAKNLVEQLLSFSRKSHTSTRTIRFKFCIEDIIKTIQPSLPKGIILKFHLQECGSFRIDPVALERIMMNLMQNSVQAMNEHGLLEISLKPASLHDQIMKYPSPGKGKFWIKLTVKDDGKGMDKQTKERIFDPFFTTKKVGTGSGLGLTIVHSLVEQSGGILIVETAPQKGSKFHIYFPSKL
jgi:two-component system, cell cycle sensor histidine kinase and response regulator CckA